MRNEKSKIFDSLLDTFENDDIKNFANECIETIPNYFWDVGASSTGKYHCYKNDFTSREIDLLRVAGIMHDSRKSGNDEDYARNKFTRFEHPLLAANEIRTIIGFIPEEEVEFVANAIESHMGQWNTDKRSKTVLPLPENKYQKILHLADYLASRKDIEVLFDGYEAPKKEIPKLEEYIFNFGKHSGEKLIDVAKSDPGYISWAKENMTREPIRTLLMQM